MRFEPLIKDFSFNPKVPSLGEEVFISFDLYRSGYDIEIWDGGKTPKWTWKDTQNKDSATKSYKLQAKTQNFELKILKNDVLIDSQEITISTEDRVKINSFKISKNVSLEDGKREIELDWNVQNARELRIVVKGDKHTVNSGINFWRGVVDKDVSNITLLATGYTDKIVYDKIDITTESKRDVKFSRELLEVVNSKSISTPKVSNRKSLSPKDISNDVGTKFKINPTHNNLKERKKKDPPDVIKREVIGRKKGGTKGNTIIGFGLIIIGIFGLLLWNSKGDNELVSHRSENIENGAIEKQVQSEKSNPKEVPVNKNLNNEILTLLNEGNKYAQLNDSESAIRKFKEVIRYNVSHPEITNLANIYLNEAQEQCKLYTETNSPGLKVFANQYFDYASILSKSSKRTCD